MARKRKKKTVEGAAKDANVVMFTALSMILLAFFIVLNSIAVIDQNRKLAAWGSLLGSFGILPGGVLLQKGEQLLPYESPVVAEGEGLEDTMQAIERYIVEYQLIEDVAFTYEGRNLRISVSSELLFLPGTDRFNPANLPFLNLITRLVGNSENRVGVEGHLAEKEVARYGVDPWELSLKRGIKVIDYMRSRGKVPAERFSLGAYGTTKPLKNKGSLKKKDGRIDITFLGEIRLRKREDRGIYRYKGFIFDFREGV